MRLAVLACALLAPLAASAVEHASAPPDEPEESRRPARRHEREPEPTYALVVKDLRLSLGASSAPERIDTDDIPGQNGTFAVERRGIPTAALTYTFGRLQRGGGPLVGTGIDLTRGTVDARTPAGRVAFDFERYDGLIKFGYGLPLGAHAHLEILPYLGVGFGSTSIHGGKSANQATGEAGIDAGLYLRFGLSTVGISAGWGGASSWGDTTLHGQGPQGMVAAGFAF